MARRFGRNQKRAMRREIGRLLAELSSANNQLRVALLTCRRLGESLDMCKRSLGPHFVGFDPVVMAARIEDLFGSDSFRSDSFRVSAPDGRAVDMRMLLTDVQSDDIRGNMHMHLRASLDGSDAAYCISRRALYRGDYPETVLVERISREMAAALVADLRRMHRGEP